jgi:hypothetical protein
LEPSCLIRIVIVRDIQPVVDGWVSTCPATSKLSRATSRNSSLLLLAPDCWLPIHGNIVFAGTILAAEPVSVCTCQSFEGVRGLGDVHCLGRNATFGTEAARGLASDQSDSAFPKSPKLVSAGISSYLTSSTTQSLAQRRPR